MHNVREVIVFRCCFVARQAIGILILVYCYRDLQWVCLICNVQRHAHMNNLLVVIMQPSMCGRILPVIACVQEKERLVVQLITLQATLAELDAALHTKAQQRSELDSKLQVLDGQRRVITDPQQQQVQR